MAAKRGQCPVCRYRHPLRKDGTMQAHPVYCGSERRECDGGGQPPVPFARIERWHNHPSLDICGPSCPAPGTGWDGRGRVIDHFTTPGEV